MVRDQSVAQDMAEQGAELLVADLENEFSAALAGCQKVVFTAGSGANTGAEKTLLIDLWAACKAVDYAKQQAVQQFVMVSSRGADNPDQGPAAIKPYLVAKHFADEYLLNSSVPYTILQPGRLLDQPGSGLVSTQRPADPAKQCISREDTAQAIYHCLTHSHTIGRVYELYQAELQASPRQQSIVQALL